MANFIQALDRLQEALDQDYNDFIRDSVIQRFEIVYELAWKTLKQYFRFQGEECDFPRSAFKLAFKHGLIQDEQLFLNMIDDRSATSHVYSEDKAQRVFHAIADQYYGALRQLQNQLQSRIN